MKTIPIDLVHPSNENCYGGITKLEYFTGQAMQGLLVNELAWDIPEDKIAEYAVKQAKALIDALNEKGE